MPTRNPTAYCPNCKQNVLLVREDINWPLAIVLLIFTGGIGLIIYLIIYYNNPENTCIHCRNKVLASTAGEKSKTLQDPYVSNQVEESQLNYCPFCGEQLSRENLKFCSNCGSSL